MLPVPLTSAAPVSIPSIRWRVKRDCIRPSAAASLASWVLDAAVMIAVPRPPLSPKSSAVIAADPDLNTCPLAKAPL